MAEFGLSEASFSLPDVAQAVHRMRQVQAGGMDLAGALRGLQLVETLLHRVLVQNNARQHELVDVQKFLLDVRFEIARVASLYQAEVAAAAAAMGGGAAAVAAAPAPVDPAALPLIAGDPAALQAAGAAPVPAPAEHESPNVMDRYRQIGEPLRKTIYGEVILAESLRTPGQLVAIKKSDMSRVQAGMLENPEREVNILVALRDFGALVGASPYVLRAIESTVFGGFRWTVLDYCAGGEFFDVIAAHGRLPDAMSARIFYQILEGLHFIHRAGYCHLDVSLENVLLRGPFGRAAPVPVICDFGMARELLPGGAPYPADGTRPGKVGYRPPEIWANRSFDGVKADVFSLGVMLFIMLTGTPPFDHARDSDARWNHIANGNLDDLLRRWGFQTQNAAAARFVNPHAIDLMQKMLLPDYRNRPSPEQIAGHPWFEQHRQRQQQ